MHKEVNGLPLAAMAVVLLDPHLPGVSLVLSILTPQRALCCKELPGVPKRPFLSDTEGLQVWGGCSVLGDGEQDPTDMPMDCIFPQRQGALSTV